MTTITIDDTKHRYEIVPIIDGAHSYPHLMVGQWVRESTGEERSKAAAATLLDERPEVERVHVYHTHPSPGPVRRFLATVSRDGWRYAMGER